MLKDNDSTIKRKIAAAAAAEQELIDRDNWEKYHHLYDITINVLKRHKILLYGGSAINSLFPKKYAFYGPYELPDLDLYCLDVTAIRDDLINTFKQSEYKAVKLEALHKGTWKIAVHGAIVADITQIPEDVFHILERGSIRGNLGLKTASIEYLRYTLYVLMSKPVDSRRWDAVFERMMLFNRFFPLKANPALLMRSRTPASQSRPYSPSSPSSIIQNIVDRMHNYIKKKQYVAFGQDVMNLYLNHEQIPALDGSYMNILVDSASPKKIGEEIIAKFPSFPLSLEKPQDINSFFISDYAYITYQGQRILGIFNTGEGNHGVCLSYVMYNGYRIASIHTIIHLYYNIYFNNKNKNIKIAAAALQLIHALITVQMKMIGSKRQIFNQFPIECYGSQQKLITLRREKYLRKL